MNIKKLFLNTEKNGLWEKKLIFLLFRHMEKHGSMYKWNEQEKNNILCEFRCKAVSTDNWMYILQNKSISKSM